MRVKSERHHTPKGYETHCRRIVAECQQQRRDLSRQADPRRHPVLRQVRQLPAVPEVRRLSGLREFADCQGGGRADDARQNLLLRHRRPPEGRSLRGCDRRQRTDELFPRYATATWWTNLPEDADTVVRLCHDHATCEQFHSELKTDMDVERLPSGDCGTNSPILSLSTPAFTVLRRIGQTALQVEAEGGTKRPERIRLRTVILTLMYAAAIDGNHGGRKHLRLGRNCHRCPPLYRAKHPLQRSEPLGLCSLCVDARGSVPPWLRERRVRIVVTPGLSPKFRFHSSTAITVPETSTALYLLGPIPISRSEMGKLQPNSEHPLFISRIPVVADRALCIRPKSAPCRRDRHPRPHAGFQAPCRRARRPRSA